MSIILFIGAYVMFCAVIAFACMVIMPPTKNEEQEPTTTVTPTVEKYLKTIKFNTHFL